MSRQGARLVPRNRSAAVCGRGGTSRSHVAKPHALRLVEDDTAALRNSRFMAEREFGLRSFGAGAASCAPFAPSQSWHLGVFSFVRWIFFG